MAHRSPHPTDGRCRLVAVGPSFIARSQRRFAEFTAGVEALRGRFHDDEPAVVPRFLTGATDLQQRTTAALVGEVSPTPDGRDPDRVGP